MYMSNIKNCSHVVHDNIFFSICIFVKAKGGKDKRAKQVKTSIEQPLKTQCLLFVVVYKLSNEKYSYSQQMTSLRYDFRVIS